LPVFVVNPSLLAIGLNTSPTSKPKPVGQHFVFSWVAFGYYATWWFILVFAGRYYGNHWGLSV